MKKIKNKIQNKIKSFKENKISHEELGMIFLSAGTVLQAIIQVIIIAFISRLLSASDFGVVAILQSITSFSLIFSQFGVSQVIIQKEKISDEEIQNATTISVILGVIIAIIFLLSSSIIATFFNSEKLILAIECFAPYFIFKSFFLINEGLILRNLQFKLLSKIQIISYLFGYGFVSIFFAYLGYGYWSIIIGLYAQMFISGIMQSRIYVINMTMHLRKDIYINLLKNGSGYTSTTFLNYITEEIDNFIVGRKLGISNLGVYTRAFSLYSLCARFFGIIYDKLYFPILSKKQNEHD